MTSRLVLGLYLAAPTLASADQVWPDTDVSRQDVLAQIQAFNADLQTHESASAALQAWCDRHGPPGARIVAQRVAGVQKVAGPSERAELGVDADEPLAYRRVRLSCGERVLSEADNWYRPGRLTPEMNRLLAETETPFGLVVRPLGFQRHTMTSEILFQPPPWPPSRREGLPIPDAILRQRAVLATGDGQRFCLVVETYTEAVLVRRPDRP